MTFLHELFELIWNFLKLKKLNQLFGLTNSTICRLIIREIHRWEVENKRKLIRNERYARAINKLKPIRNETWFSNAS